MDSFFLATLFALVCYSAALGFVIYAWLNHDRPEVDHALRYCILFGTAGSFTLVILRVTSG